MEEGVQEIPVLGRVLETECLTEYHAVLPHRRETSQNEQLIHGMDAASMEPCKKDFAREILNKGIDTDPCIVLCSTIRRQERCDISAGTVSHPELLIPLL